MDIASIGSVNYASQAMTALDKESKATESFASLLESAQATGDRAEIMDACKQFESYFLQMMFRQMRQTSMQLSEDGFMPVGRAEETFQDLLDEEYSKKATNAGGIGLATFMYKQMTRGLDNAVAYSAQVNPAIQNAADSVIDDAADIEIE